MIIDRVAVSHNNWPPTFQYKGHLFRNQTYFSRKNAVHHPFKFFFHLSCNLIPMLRGPRTGTVPGPPRSNLALLTYTVTQYKCSFYTLEGCSYHHECSLSAKDPSTLMPTSDDDFQSLLLATMTNFRKKPNFGHYVDRSIMEAIKALRRSQENDKISNRIHIVDSDMY